MEDAGVPIQAEASCCQNITETFYCLKNMNGNGKKCQVVAIICFKKQKESSQIPLMTFPCFQWWEKSIILFLKR